MRTRYVGSLSILTSLFFIWGFITCLNDILIPHLKAMFTLNYTQAMLVQCCFFGAYFIMSVPSGYCVAKIGYQHGMTVGLFIAGVGCLLFYPASFVQSYLLFLSAFFVLASGITLLQVSANPYVTVLGSPTTAATRLTLTQAFNSLGTTLAPYFGALFILENPAPEALQNAYLSLAGALFTLTVFFACIKLPLIQAPSQSAHQDKKSNNTQAWQHPQLVLGAIAIFVYVGGEVAIGSFLVSFLGQTQIANLSPHVAGKYVSFYWGGAMIGRFIGAALMAKIAPSRFLLFNALAAILLIFLAMFTHGELAMWSLLSVGLCNSIMFPTIFSLALNGLGTHTGQGSGILCMAIVGGAIIPLLQGIFADYVGLTMAFFVPIMCYAYIAFYGLQYQKYCPLHITK